MCRYYNSVINISSPAEHANTLDWCEQPIVQQFFFNKDAKT